MPEVLTTMSQGSHGRTALSQARPIRQLLRALDAFPPLDQNTAELLGSHVDDFLRGTATLRKSSAEDIAACFENVRLLLGARPRLELGADALSVCVAATSRRLLRRRRTCCCPNCGSRARSWRSAR